MQSNDKAGVAFAQPATKKERDAIATQCCEKLKMSVRLLVDEIDYRVGHRYSGMPDRLYLIDREGRIAYKGGRGPFGFKPGELEQAIIMMLMEKTTTKKVNAASLLAAAEEAIVAALPTWAQEVDA